MNKSIYSLVLSDEVVEAIDRAAYSVGTSRSNMINQILAEYVSYVTPERRIKDIFSALERMLIGENGFQPMLQASDSMMSLRSALAYKYNPTVRYSVELDGGSKGGTGVLRVMLRSQSQELLMYTAGFFHLWSRMEDAYIAERERTSEPGRFTRGILFPEGLSGEEKAEAIAAYIRAVDQAMKRYFKMLPDVHRAAAEAETVYRSYLSSGQPLI